MRVYKIILLLLVLLFVNGCPDNNNPLKPDNKTVYGNSKEYVISNFANGEVKDEITGLTFVFKDATDGTLKITKLLSGDQIDTTLGINFEFKYSGSSSVLIRCNNTNEESAYLSMLVPNELPSHFDGEFPENIFFALSHEDTNKIPTEYELYDLDFIDGKINKKDNEMLQSKLKRASYILRYMQIPHNSSDEFRLKELWSILYNMRRDIVEEMPQTLKDKALLKIKEYYFSGRGVYPADKTAAYVPWWVWGAGNPYFCFVVNKSGGADRIDNTHAVAHELGHYFSHIMNGDDYYSKLIEEQNCNPHYIGVNRKNRDMIEEYAHFMDFFMHRENGTLTNNGRKFFLEAPTDIFRREFESELINISWDKVTPKNYDFPTIEGFGAFLLARTTSSSKKIQSIWDKTIQGGKFLQEDIPALNLSFENTLEILFSKPLYTTTELGYEIINFIAKKGGDNALRCPAFFERCGWSYNGKVRILDTKGVPVKFAKAKNISQVGPGEIYYAGANSTDDNGYIEFDRLFPTNSIIRVYYNMKGSDFKDSVDVDLSIELSKETNKQIDLGEIKVNIQDESEVFSKFQLIVRIPCMAKKDCGAGERVESAVLDHGGNHAKDSVKLTKNGNNYYANWNYTKLDGVTFKGSITINVINDTTFSINFNETKSIGENITDSYIIETKPIPVKRSQLDNRPSIWINNGLKYFETIYGEKITNNNDRKPGEAYKCKNTFFDFKDDAQIVLHIWFED